MIQATIVIELTSGTKIKYVRDSLYAKSGSDGATNPAQKNAGVPTKFYSYTGDGDDTYDDQTGNSGMILDDLSAIETSFASSNPVYLSFPESAGATDELVRYNIDQKNGRRVYVRTKILKDKIARIYVEEIWTEGSDKTDSKDTLPKWSPRYMKDGWNEERNGEFTFPNVTAKTLTMPKILTKTSTINSITITWALDTNYSSYDIYQGTNTVVSNVNVGTYTFTGLKTGTEYCVGVCGKTADGKKCGVNYLFVKTL